ncbi:stage V sporulation protein B [Calorimonas adulescens]|uniref:stage V sporulation protein B n=1 Tax=Calorimonas adulescens TaxID=2606906 RepID=UPI001396B030|nr:stage V sporulation protein B [Calorimonas adulescens]
MEEKLSFAQGAFILTIANLISRLLGFIFRIVLSNKIGPEGMGIFQLVMPVYMTALSVTTGSISVTVSRLVAQSLSRGDRRYTYRIVSLSLMLITSISAIISGILIFFSDYISSSILNEERTMLPIIIFSPVLFIISSSAVIRGYFEGIQNIKPSAIANIIEEVVRIISVLFLIDAVMPMGIEYAVSAAIFSSVLGEVCVFLFMAYKYKERQHKYKASTSGPHINNHKLMLNIVGTTIPLSLNRFVNTFLQSIEAVIIPQRLMANLSKEESLSIFGELTGMALPIVMLPSIVVNALSVTLVPAVAEAHEKNDMATLEHRVKESVEYTLIISFITSTTLLSLPNEIAITLYHNTEVGIFLRMFSLVVPLIYTSQIMNSALNGMGKHTIAFINNLFASFMRTLCTYILVANSKFMINGYFIGYYLGFLLLFILDYICIRRFIGIFPGVVFFAKTFIASIVFYLCLKIFYCLNPIPNSLISLVITLLLSLIIYLLIMVHTGVLRTGNLIGNLPFLRRV